ncbi:MAG TPA: response regulator transcription factor [Candidatus Saccharimonadales bacterium]|nr:response regulator transcription factor [Candidatus Saccharimonadales bacterium]
MKIKLLVADDSDVMRGAIRRVLQESVDVSLVGEATTFTQTARLASELKPDVIVIDLHMSDSDEYTLAKVLKASLGCPIIAMSLYEDEETRKMAESFKAVKFLDKTKLYQELVPTIRQFSRLNINPRLS